MRQGNVDQAPATSADITRAGVQIAIGGRGFPKERGNGIKSRSIRPGRRIRAACIPKHKRENLQSNLRALRGIERF